MKRAVRGFTLIELMVTMAVLGILVAMALPQYQNYMTRVRWQDAVITLDLTRKATVECIQLRSGNPSLCQTDSDIGMVMPTAAAGGRVAISRGSFTSGSGGSGGIMTFVMSSSNPSMGGCTVTVTGTSQVSHVSWTYVTSGAGCSKANTGY